MNPSSPGTPFLIALALALVLHTTGCGREGADGEAPASTASPPIGQGAGEAVPPPLTGYSLAPMLDKVLPAIVNVSTESVTRRERNPLLDDPFFRRFFDLPVPESPREQVTRGLGSGVILDAQKGHVVTNHHVIEGADTITVTLRDRRSFPAKLVGGDPDTDVALLKIEADGLAALQPVDSDRLRVGDFVVAIGNPFGLRQTVTYGIVSALARSGLGLGGYENFIQTDASINPGNSGGALVTTEGALVGINSAIVGSNGGNIGIGFAIPSNMVMAIVEQLEAHGEVRRGRLGVAVQDLTPKLASAFGSEATSGAVVTQVEPGSPAEKAGLEVGDIILSANDRPVGNAAALRNMIGLLPLGTRISLVVLRDGKQLTLEAEPEAFTANRVAAGKANEHLAGVELGEIGPGHPLAGEVAGVRVARIERDSAAWKAGLREGDIIVSVNRVPVRSLDEFAQAAPKSGNGILLNVRRGSTTLFLVLD